MSRTKKSRKQGSAPTAKPKLSKVELANVEKRVRKKTGKKPGNRQQEAQSKTGAEQNTNQNKDPRIGSKKPIDLGVATSAAQTKTVKPKQSKTAKVTEQPIAAIRRIESVDNEQNLAEELAAIEADEHLQIILAKQEDELLLTEEEVNYFNEMMERHQQISDQLDDDEEDQVTHNRATSEDDLWDKLDNSSLLDSFKDKDSD